MADQTQQMQSIFPDIPRESPEVDKDGNLTPLWSLGFGALFQALQENFKSEGILFPPLAENNVAYIQSLYAQYIGGSYDALTQNLPDISGQTVYNLTTKTTNQFVINQDNNGIVTLAQWVPLSVILTAASNPNGNTAGVLNWLCYDMAEHHLWICTASGSTTTAVWAQTT